MHPAETANAAIALVIAALLLLFSVVSLVFLIAMVVRPWMRASLRLHPCRYSTSSECDSAVLMSMRCSSG